MPRRGGLRRDAHGQTPDCFRYLLALTAIITSAEAVSLKAEPPKWTARKLHHAAQSRDWSPCRQTVQRAHLTSRRTKTVQPLFYENSITRQFPCSKILRARAVWQPTPLPVTQLVARRAELRRACEAIEREPIPTRMSFRIELSNITGNAPPAGKERPTGHGTPVEVAADLLRYREAAGLDAFQINFHGNRDLDQLLQSMECFMREAAPMVSDR
jgi:hypothetical protein